MNEMVWADNFLQFAPSETPDVDARHARFVAVTEGPISNWGTTYWIDMAGANLSRFVGPTANPVCIDSHDRSTANCVLGRVELTKEEGRLIADIYFADTERALEVWRLVEGGFLRAVSIGFNILRTEEIEAGASGQLRDREITGPATIVRAWELSEISVVPVGADPRALRFAHEQSEILGSIRGIEKALNIVTTKKEVPMLEPQTEVHQEILDADRRIELARKAKEERTIIEDSIRGIAPKSLSADVVDKVVLLAADVKEARGLFLKELSAASSTPSGDGPQTVGAKPQKKEFSAAEMAQFLSQ